MKIVTLSTYPIDTPFHGGQHRLRNIVDCYRAAGHNVRSLGVLGSSEYAKSDGFLPHPGANEFTRFIADPFLMEDFAIGRMAVGDDRLFSELAAQFDGDPPDAIHIEQPWLFPFALRYCSEQSGGRSKLIYGSQNVEHELKRRIVKAFANEKRADDCARMVLDLEMSALQLADMICCVSEGDAEWTKQHARCSVVVGANGVRDRVTTHTGLAQANRITGHRKHALYCASGHPPNISGFFEIFGRGVGCFSPDERIVVAGGAAGVIRGDARFPKTPGLASHYVPAGTVTDECLQGLLTTAHVVVLPVTEGGGTNLKSAEAIWSGCHVVATPTAMRGFEGFMAARGLSVCSTPLARPALRVWSTSA